MINERLFFRAVLSGPGAGQTMTCIYLIVFAGLISGLEFLIKYWTSHQESKKIFQTCPLIRVESG